MGYTLRYDFEMKDLHAFSNQPAAFSHLRVVDSYNVLNEVAQNRESFLSHLKKTIGNTLIVMTCFVHIS